MKSLFYTVRKTAFVTFSLIVGSTFLSAASMATGTGTDKNVAPAAKQVQVIKREFFKRAFDDLTADDKRAGQARDNEFELTVCNKSRMIAYVALSHYSDDHGEWVIEGWWKIKRRQCRYLKRVRKGKFYVFADSNNGKWSGKAIRLCVGRTKPFFRVNRSNYKCKSHEKLEGFIEKSTQADEYKWTLTN